MCPSGGQTLAIQLPPVRSSLGTLGLYQDLETSNSSWSGARDVVGSLYRRHSPNGRDQGESTGTGVQPHLPAKLPGLHKKNRENSHRADTNAGVSRFYCELINNGADPPIRKNKKNLGRVPEVVGGRASINLRSFETSGQNERHKSNNTTAPLFYIGLQMDLKQH